MSHPVSTPLVDLLEAPLVGLSPILAQFEWDERVRAGAAFTTGDSLLAHLREPRLPHQRTDVVLVSDTYRDAKHPLAVLLPEVRAAAPESALMLLLSWPDPVVLTAAMATGASAVFLNEEIAYGLPSGIAKARGARFAYTRGLEPLLRRDHPEHVRLGTLIPSWELHRDLQPCLHRTAEQYFLQGRQAVQVAASSKTSPGTIHRYATTIRHLLLPELDGPDFYDVAALRPRLVQMKEQYERDKQNRDKDAPYRHLLASLPLPPPA